jgi:hypothetical protein
VVFVKLLTYRKGGRKKGIIIRQTTKEKGYEYEEGRTIKSCKSLYNK